MINYLLAKNRPRYSRERALQSYSPIFSHPLDFEVQIEYNSIYQGPYSAACLLRVRW